jgi:hypothetical protein
MGVKPADVKGKSKDEWSNKKSETHFMTDFLLCYDSSRMSCSGSLQESRVMVSL